jgi:hypothetical protein
MLDIRKTEKGLRATLESGSQKLKIYRAYDIGPEFACLVQKLEFDCN